MLTPRQRILCIDDDEFCHELLCFHLTEYEMNSLKTLAEGLRRAESERFDLYLLDHFLPDGSGIELCRQIRRFDAATPIVIISADARPATREEALRAGAQVFFSKPVDFDELKRLITEMLSR
ncbi:MAG TPA: response regulator [Blastocatellia bacterium]|nr:response regulator [Blastocatellia bacterium]